jgi:uncharacterized protein (DUF433 family)
MIVWHELFASNPNICDGDLCAIGTRIPITVILDSLAEGSSKEEILRSFPTLLPTHIEAALAYAAELAHEESMLPIRDK